MRKSNVVLWLGFSAACAFSFASQGAVAATKPPVRDWTVLVFMNGNNSLDAFTTVNLKQMEKVGSTDDVAVVVQWASLEAGHTVRMLMEKNDDSSRVASPVIANLGRVDMGDWRKLVEFIRWGAEHYPARHYLIDVWNHGSGWHSTQLQSLGAGPKTFDSLLHPLDISWDDFSGHAISTQDLGRSMREAAHIIGHKVDIYGSDACLMAMAEVASEMRDSVKYFIGSEELEPSAGWPYDAILGRMRTLGHASPLEVATMISQEYTASYPSNANDPDAEDVTLSTYDLDAAADLERAVAGLGRDISRLGAAALTQVRDVLRTAQRFDEADYVDLGDFVRGLRVKGIRGIRASTYGAIDDAFGDFVIANHVSPSYARAAGVAIWLPQTATTFNRYGAIYRDLRFDRATRWGEAVRKLVDSRP